MCRFISHLGRDREFGTAVKVNASLLRCVSALLFLVSPSLGIKIFPGCVSCCCCGLAVMGTLVASLAQLSTVLGAIAFFFTPEVDKLGFFTYNYLELGLLLP